MASRFFNISLRLGSLATRMLLMLYMGKYLGLYDLGTYGLIAATVAISIPIFGMRLEYAVSRDIVGLSSADLVIKLRDEFLFYIFNYILLVVGALLWVLLFSPETSLKIVGFTVLLCVLEGLSVVVCSNFVALGRPILSNTIFFLRSSIWVFFVIILGICDPSFRTIETIIILWLGGLFLSLLMAVYVWKDLPWKKAFSIQFDREQLYTNLMITIPIWIGDISMAISSYLNRFVTEYFLDREFVGIISFYGSFTMAIHSLLASGIFAFALPKMIAMHKNHESKELSFLTKKITIQATFLTIILCIIIGVAIPILGNTIDRPELKEQAHVLWLMLFAVCISTITSSLYHLSYARHQDWAIWGGALLQLVLSVPLNIIMVSNLGFVGVGYSSIVVVSVIGVWRVFCTHVYNRRHKEEMGKGIIK